MMTVRFRCALIREIVRYRYAKGEQLGIVFPEFPAVRSISDLIVMGVSPCGAAVRTRIEAALLFAEQGMKDFLKPAEIILITLLVALAMGIWSAVDSPLAETLRRIEPSEDEIQLEHEVPRLQSVAKANEDGLAATRAKVQELELELAQRSSHDDKVASRDGQIRRL